MSFELVIAVISGMLTCIPLCLKLFSAAQQVARERNWTKLLSLVMELMEDAEEFLQDGQSKKQWVMAGLSSLSGFADYDIDESAVSELIDSLCELANNLNSEAKKA